MDSPLFSVIIPTHARREFLEMAVASVLAQTLGNFECIVVDDASPEPVKVPPDPRLRVIRRDRKGGSAAARNTGLRVARGRYVTFLDDDDELTPRRLVLALDGLARAPIAICWKGYLDEPWGTPSWRRVLEGDIHDTILEEAVPSVGQTALERRLAPHFDEEFTVSEDVEWWVRLSFCGSVATIPMIGYLVRQHGGQRQTSRLAARLRCRLLLLQKHSEYFAHRPRAAAYHWKRAGGLAQRLGDHALARAAFMKAVALYPEAATFLHLVRSLRRSTTVTEQRSALLERSAIGP